MFRVDTYEEGLLIALFGGIDNATQSHWQPPPAPMPKEEPIIEDKEPPIIKHWEVDLEIGLNGVEVWKVQAFICMYQKCFAFGLHDLQGYKGKPIKIHLEDDQPIFRQPYQLSFLERDVKACWQELLVAGLVEPLDGELS